MLRGGKIPKYGGDFFAFNGDNSVIYKNHFIYKSPTENAKNIELTLGFDYRPIDNIGPALLNLEKEVGYELNLKNAVVMQNENVDVVLDYIDCFKFIDNQHFVNIYGSYGMESIFTHILNCKENPGHRKFI